MSEAEARASWREGCWSAVRDGMFGLWSERIASEAMEVSIRESCGLCCIGAFGACAVACDMSKTSMGLMCFPSDCV